jgi:hypothetical protein
MTELIVIACAAAVGWLAVWYGMTALRIGSSPTVDTDADAETSWPALLGVAADTAVERIEEAYQRRLAELAAAAPRLMTGAERAAQDAARAQLDAAYRCAMASRER